MYRIPEAEYTFGEVPGYDEWYSIIASTDIPWGVIDISSCLSIVPDEESDIRAHVLSLDYDIEAITAKQLVSLIDVARSIFFLRDLGFCDKQSFSFLMVLASYVDETRGSRVDMMRLFADIKRVPGICGNAGGDRISIGMMCKLFGLTKIRDMRRMDCPRVWDLKTDQIVDNPNFGKKPVHQIAAITHKWQAKEFVYKDLMKIEQTNMVLEKLGNPQEPMKISSMSPKLAKIKEELEGTIRYVWMDTLCIDKTNSAELDMSIRSMFRWYSNAAFVYLEYYTDFSKWRTRGWTLQEGAAAKSLVISPKHGKFFMELVASIDDDAGARLGLREWHGYRGSLYWLGLMESRKTTMIEDKAYALIGLLGINLQIAYGEGEKAMDRICEELAKQKGDVSWLATTRYRDAMNVNKRSLPMDEIRESTYSDNPPCHEIYVTGAGMKLGVRSIPDEFLKQVYDEYERAFGHKLEVGDGKCYWVRSSNTLLVLKHDQDRDCYKIYGARCIAMDLQNLPGMLITIDYKYSENKRDSVLGRREP